MCSGTLLYLHPREGFIAQRALHFGSLADCVDCGGKTVVPQAQSCSCRCMRVCVAAARRGRSGYTMVPVAAVVYRMSLCCGYISVPCPTSRVSSPVNLVHAKLHCQFLSQKASSHPTTTGSWQTWDSKWWRQSQRCLPIVTPILTVTATQTDPRMPKVKIGTGQRLVGAGGGAARKGAGEGEGEAEGEREGEGAESGERVSAGG